MSLAQYEYLKYAWITAHPNSTPSEYQKAMIAIAKKFGV